MQPILTLDERVLLKKYYLAYDAFTRAIDQINFVTEYRSKFNTGVLYINSLSIIFILYGRPFTNNRGIGKLSEEIIPDCFIEYHKTLLLYRNKLIAHIDHDGQLPDCDASNLVDFEIHVKNNKSEWRMTSPFPNVKELNKYKELISF